MSFEVFTVAYNEAEMLPFFVNHYRGASKITVFDNDSTDGTAAIANLFGAVVKRLDTGGCYDEDAQTRIRNERWRGSAADWVVVVDVDELIDLTPLESVEPCRVAFECRGRNMIGRDGELPGQVHRCLPADAKIPGVETRYNKISVFSPAIGRIDYAPGMHAANPDCEVVRVPALILRHYCWLGEEFIVRRFRARRHRISVVSRAKGYGFQYQMSDDQIRAAYRACLAAAIPEDESCLS